MDVRVTVTFGVSGDKRGYIIKASVLAKRVYFLILVVSTLICSLHTNSLGCPFKMCVFSCMFAWAKGSNLSETELLFLLPKPALLRSSHLSQQLLYPLGHLQPHSLILSRAKFIFNSCWLFSVGLASSHFVFLQWNWHFGPLWPPHWSLSFHPVPCCLLFLELQPDIHSKPKSLLGTPPVAPISHKSESQSS